MNMNNEKSNNSCEMNPSQVEFNQIACEREASSSYIQRIYDDEAFSLIL